MYFKKYYITSSIFIEKTDFISWFKFFFIKLSKYIHLFVDFANNKDIFPLALSVDDFVSIQGV